MKKILITGGAGFIASHLSKKISNLKEYKIYVVDNLNNYYNKNLKKYRVKDLLKSKNIIFKKIDICNKLKIIELFKLNKFEYVFHFAAQAGVRYSIKNPKIYFENNIKGFFNILENSRIYKAKCLFFASSSSVYGDQKIFPINEEFNTNNPESFYAATKKCNEIIAKSYSNIYNMRLIGFRFFTVYGSFGRPDMTPYVFLEKSRENKTINIFNKGIHERDFTHINDVINYIIKIFEKQKKNKIKNNFEIFNVSKGKSEKLIKYITELESQVGRKFKKRFVKKQMGDVLKTFGDNSKIKKLTKYQPQMSLKDGLKEFLQWYKKYYNI
tara:strand:+ start:310 stop:1287 length:978 start_codon:yes stop_codon:yes gene_type:complete